MYNLRCSNLFSVLALFVELVIVDFVAKFYCSSE
jgi:hypothetical protein